MISDTAVPSPFPGSVSDLMEVACGAGLPPIPADPGTCPPRVQILIAGSHLSGTALWVDRWSVGLRDSEPSAVMQRMAQEFLPWGSLPAQPSQGVCHAVVPSTLPDDLRPFLGQLVPTALK